MTPPLGSVEKAQALASQLLLRKRENPAALHAKTCYACPPSRECEIGSVENPMAKPDQLPLHTNSGNDMIGRPPTIKQTDALYSQSWSLTVCEYNYKAMATVDDHC